jgi:guanylate kinase
MTDHTRPATPAPPRVHQGILFVLSGPAGVGKDTLLRRALRGQPGIRTSISVTTRQPRPREVDGVDYHFITPEEYQRLVADDALLEHAEVHGHGYGTPADWVEAQLAAGTDVVLEIDVQGAERIRALRPATVLVFIAPPSMEELERRLRGRATEDEATIQRRLANARGEMAAIPRYDYVIVNDNLDEAVARFRETIEQVRTKTAVS